MNRNSLRKKLPAAGSAGIPSVQIAKERLKNLLNADRMQCTPDMTEKMTSDLYRTLEKYIPIDSEEFEMQITRTDIHIKYTGEYD